MTHKVDQYRSNHAEGVQIKDLFFIDCWSNVGLIDVSPESFEVMLAVPMLSLPWGENNRSISFRDITSSPHIIYHHDHNFLIITIDNWNVMKRLRLLKHPLKKPFIMIMIATIIKIDNTIDNRPHLYWVRCLCCFLAVPGYFGWTIGVAAIVLNTMCLWWWWWW